MTIVMKQARSTLTPPSHTVIDVTSGVASWGKSPGFVILYNDLKDTILRQYYNEPKYARMWNEFEHGEANEERAHNVEVAQDIANFEDRLAREEANFQLQQTQG